MKKIVFAALVAVSAMAFTGEAQAQVCKNLATVDACVRCSIGKGGLNRFSQEGMRSWCQGQIANRPARVVPASRQRTQQR